MKKVAFPKVEDFRELFAEIGPYIDTSKIVAEWPAPAESQSKIKVRGYCSIRLGDMIGTFTVKPSQLVLEYLKSTFTIPGEVFFRAELRGPEVLVVVRYESLLVDRWLATVWPATVPGL